MGNLDQFVQYPLRLARCGRQVSSKAKVIFVCITSYNPSYPSFSQIAEDSGYSREAIRNALEELEIKNVVDVIHGKKIEGERRENNRYRARHPSQWQLDKKVIRPSDKHRLKAVRKAAVGSIIEPVTSSIIEPIASSIIEQEIDQIKIYPLENDATRQRCPTDNISKAGKGVLPDNIRKQVELIKKGLHPSGRPLGL